MTSYADFLIRKAQLAAADGIAPTWMPQQIFPFQAVLVEWALRAGRGGVFADCGLGKTLMQLTWAENVRRRTGRPVLVVAPLAVTFQVEEEGEKFGIDVATSRDGSVRSGITVTNYDRLHLFDPSVFGGAVCDESSAIKAFDGKLRRLVTEFMRQMPYRLLSTATAAPNDYVELGTSSEALGYLGHMDMLSRFFVNDRKVPHGSRRAPGWRFKGHAEEPFWRWVASWARAIRRPSDLGFPDDGFALPPLEEREHVIQALGARTGSRGDVAVGLHEEREELRRTLHPRCERAADLLARVDSGVAWCQLNDESALLTSLIDGAVEVSGSEPSAVKEEKLHAFSKGQIRVLVTKPKIGGWGLNWQHCHRTTFFPTHSYEQYYQAVRRFWRFGQENPVTVDLITTDGGGGALSNLRRKSEQADRMFDALIRHMSQGQRIQRTDDFDQKVEVPSWLATC